MRNLWIPLVVRDVDASTRFYRETLGLSPVDGWATDAGERGAVFAVDGPGHIEVVQPAPGATEPPPPTIALELDGRADVDALRARLDGSTPRVYPRGYYGFVAHDPDGNAILLWSEKNR
jgi:catechol 2,3-dioxygenase-like lactoylglutathione lyase family enzyme